MRKIILGLAISLDSYIEGPNGEYDWCFTDQDYGMKEFMDRIDAIFYGRKSWDLMQEASLQEAGQQWAGKKNYVFSKTLKSSTQNYTLVNGNLAQAVAQIKEQPGKDIWLFGGAALTKDLMNLQLVDELWLSVHPILLGKGKPLFEGLDHRVKTKLTRSKIYDTGLVSLTYEIVKEPA